ncbi:MAG TPA: metallophosphoesterase [Leucothrix mucor]|nr:metallophosphoesterase [Leucothrix mucor]
MIIKEQNVSIGIISDTHAHLDERIIEVLKGCDYAIHGGDICGEDILESMQPKTGEIFVVAGNNDQFCHVGRALPHVVSLELPNGKVTIEHGHMHGHHKPSHDSMREAYADSRIVIYGHTHKQVIDKTATPWIINPGAAGITRNHGGPSCLILRCENDDWDVEMIRFENIEETA